MNETTGAAPTGLNFGQCGASATLPRIANFMAAHLSIPWKRGYSYQRWRKANSLRTSDLRTIVLLNSQFNVGNKVLARRLAQVAEQNKRFAVEQHGSRKHHRAIEQAVNKRLTFDIAYQQRRPLALCTNDLKSCYEHINHAFAFLCLQRQGVSEAEVTCLFTTLQTMEHTIRTAYRDFTLTIGGGVWEVVLCGSIYQGNGAGPIIWAVVSTPLLQARGEQDPN